MGLIESTNIPNSTWLTYVHIQEQHSVVTYPLQDDRVVVVPINIPLCLFQWCSATDITSINAAIHPRVSIGSLERPCYPVRFMLIWPLHIFSSKLCQNFDHCFILVMGGTLFHSKTVLEQI